MSNLLDVLQNDRKTRIVGFEGKTFTLDTLNLKSKWDYSYPTLVSITDYEKNERKEIKIRTNDSFCNEFFRKYPEFKNFNFNNVLISGGCVSSLLIGDRCNDVDVDIFIHNCTLEEAKEKAKYIFSQISRNLFDLDEESRLANNKNYKKNKYDEDNSSNTYKRSKNCLTMNSKYQVILRIYTSPFEILHGFDLGSSAVGFNGKEVLFTPLSKFCYENMINIVDTTRRSTTYETRLVKYMDRGFRIVLPELDFSKLNDDKFRKFKYANLCDLPFLCFSYGKIERNKIQLDRFMIERKQESDYDEYSEVYACFFNNIKYLLRNEVDRMIYISQNLQDIFDKPRIFDRDRIDSFYDGFEIKLKSNFFPKLSVKHYIDVATPEQVFSASDEELSKIIAFQKANVLTLADNFENTSLELSWMVENCGTQLTGSYNPIIEEPEKWYGEFYNKGLTEM